MRSRLLLAAALSAAAVAAVAGQASVATPPSAPSSVSTQVDAVFARWNADTPGCAVGVSAGGKPVLARAYGMADLEHGIRNEPDTIFEAGSVSKQFTAAAILLLARDGKLSLDDPARKYIPELPAHTNEGATPITIRQMLTHTSGLRDWGAIAAIAGWPRTSRVYTHAHVLDIVSRQRALNFTPGTRWSYSNTGYNLAAIIVSRVSGQSFAAFTRARIFEPLGMSHTSWRDDFTRVVKGRAMAYAMEGDGYHTLMPFENVHGNGGLLTTVGDLLKWNENFVTPVVGDAAFVAQQQEVGRFTDGTPHTYAFGLSLGTYKGLREVAHSGDTAGYRADLIRFPEARVSVAVLCNGDRATAVPDAHAVADLYLAGRLKPADRPVATHTLTAAEMDAAAGIYRSTTSGSILRVVRDAGTTAPAPAMTAAAASPSASVATSANAPAAAAKGQDAAKGLRIENGPALFAQSARRFLMGEGSRFELDPGGSAHVTGAGAVPETYERMAPATATAAQLAALAGEYVSDEAEMVLTLVVEGTSVSLRRRPDRTLRLAPLYTDAFRASQLGTVVFERGADGRGTTLRIVQGRVWDLRFTRRPDAAASATGR